MIKWVFDKIRSKDALDSFSFIALSDERERIFIPAFRKKLKIRPSSPFLVEKRIKYEKEK